MTKADAEQQIAAVLAMFEESTGSGVVAIDIEVDALMVHAITDPPSKARKIGVRLYTEPRRGT